MNTKDNSGPDSPHASPKFGGAAGGPDFEKCNPELIPDPYNDPPAEVKTTQPPPPKKTVSFKEDLQSKLLPVYEGPTEKEVIKAVGLRQAHKEKILNA